MIPVDFEIEIIEDLRQEAMVEDEEVMDREVRVRVKPVARRVVEDNRVEGASRELVDGLLAVEGGGGGWWGDEEVIVKGDFMKEIEL